VQPGEDSQGVADLIGRFGHDNKAAKAFVPFGNPRLHRLRAHMR